MIRISGIDLPLDCDFSDLRSLCEAGSGIPSCEIKSVRLAKRSVDARRKNNIHFTVSLDIEAQDEDVILKKVKGASKVSEWKYRPEKVEKPEKRPVIVGFGPAGMFAALILAEAGAEPVILERGGDVGSRCAAVDSFRKTGVLDTECNIQFGEGGAGTFSDGKLTTGIKDDRVAYVFDRLYGFGAPDDILFSARPHIGTDNLRGIVQNLREYIISLGAKVIFGARFSDFTTDNNKIKTVKYLYDGAESETETDHLILACGHSARDVFELLYEKGIGISAKNFSVGVRIEHKREDIDRAMYGKFAGHPALGAADYKLAVHLPNGRTLYTFCMCPGGYVVAAASEEEALAVNGMSYYARNAENSNSALLVGVGKDDFGSSHPLAGMYFQRRIERLAFRSGGGGYRAPSSTVGDFLKGRLAHDPNENRIRPSYTPSVRAALPDSYLPGVICDTLRAGLAEMGKKIRGFDSPDALLTGAESRSSSPVRIERGEDLQSVSLSGLFPCGEGAGYAGGIISAAVDGIRCAEAVISLLNEKDH